MKEQRKGEVCCFAAMSINAGVQNYAEGSVQLLQLYEWLLSATRTMYVNDENTLTNSGIEKVENIIQNPGYIWMWLYSIRWTQKNGTILLLQIDCLLLQCVLEKRKPRVKCKILGHGSLVFKNYPSNLINDFLFFPMIPFTPMLLMQMTCCRWFHKPLL